MSSVANESNGKGYPHPACLVGEALLKQCSERRAKRSGPGGQHRNKVETAVILTHEPTGISAEAGERRSQQQNRSMALKRLRLNLALEYRSSPNPGTNPGTGDSSNDEKNTNAGIDEMVASAERRLVPLPAISELFQSRVKGGKIVVSDSHEDFASLLAEGLDLVHMFGYDVKGPAKHIGCSASQLIKFFKKHNRAFQLINNERKKRDLHALK